MDIDQLQADGAQEPAPELVDEGHSRELAAIATALEVVADERLPLRERSLTYAILRRVRLQIDRALKPVTREITEAMVREGANRWGPLRISWRSQDPIYKPNLEGNWGDAGVQGRLEELEADAGFRPFIKRVPAHREIDTVALGKAIYEGDPGASELLSLLNDEGLRVVPQKAASLQVDG